jgi:hypothetical protein
MASFAQQSRIFSMKAGRGARERFFERHRFAALGLLNADLNVGLQLLEKRIMLRIEHRYSLLPIGVSSIGAPVPRRSLTAGAKCKRSGRSPQDGRPRRLGERISVPGPDDPE